MIKLLMKISEALDFIVTKVTEFLKFKDEKELDEAIKKDVSEVKDKLNAKIRKSKKS